jgi:hypothetical protein
VKEGWRGRQEDNLEEGEEGRKEGRGGVVARGGINGGMVGERISPLLCGIHRLD